MSTHSETFASNEIDMQHEAGLDDSLKPKTKEGRTVNPLSYMFMWMGDGVNLGNMTLGDSVIVAGVATLNIWQPIAAAIIAIAIVETIFILNDRLAYREGIPYV